MQERFLVRRVAVLGAERTGPQRVAAGRAPAAEPVPGGEYKDASLRYAMTGWPVLDSHARYMYAKASGVARLIEPSDTGRPTVDTL